MTRLAGSGLAYADQAYVDSLAEFGTPVRLPQSAGWVMERPIFGTERRDLVGPYPLFSCNDWSSLTDDLDDVDDALVSLVLVADPLGGADLPQLREAFPDHVTAFKRHLVRDLEAAASLPAHHRRHLRRAAQSVEVEVCADPLEHIDDWVELYSGLVTRHSLRGIRAFSPASFRQQFTAPGMLAVRAERGGATVSMALWLADAHNAYYHLGASSTAGYEASASYALFAAALEHLRERGIRYVDLGGVAGVGPHDDGLFRFKRGWANGDRPAYLCGRIINPRAYAALSAGAGPATTWFPAYRASDPDLATRPMTAGKE